MTNKKFDQLFGGPPRKSEAELTQREMDLAASIQHVTEDVVVQIAKGIAQKTGERNLCLAGGVALNCVANGILLRKKFLIIYGSNRLLVTLEALWAPLWRYGIYITNKNGMFPVTVTL